MTNALTKDAFLGGRLHLWQPAQGYRAGVDPVLLAASVPAKSGESVLDLGCGAGAAALCLGARVPGLVLIGVERQAEYATLARRNGLSVFEADLAHLPPEVKAQRFDHVLANPPYFDRAASTAASNQGREGALGQDTPLATWIEVAAKRLAPGGYLHLIHRAERLPELLALTQDVLGSLEVLPLYPRPGKTASLIILRARKGGRAAFKLHPPIILHDGPRHRRDGEGYSAEIEAVLRDAAPLRH